MPANPRVTNPNDKNVLYQNLSQPERDHPIGPFLHKDQLRRLNQLLNVFKNNPGRIETIQPLLRANFPLYEALYANNPQLKTPFQESVFANIVYAARNLPPNSPPLQIALLILACLKPAPGDQDPLDPLAFGPTSEYAQVMEGVIARLNGILTATWDAVYPCGGAALEGRKGRNRNKTRNSDLLGPWYSVARCFLEFVLAALEFDNVEIKFVIAHGTWATGLAQVRPLKRAIDLVSFPQVSPSFACDVFSAWHPRAIYRELLPIVRTMDLFCIALILASQQDPTRIQRTPRQIFNLIRSGTHNPRFPIGTVDQVLAIVTAQENDPIPVIYDAVMARRSLIEADEGVLHYISSSGCGGVEIESVLVKSTTSKGVCFSLLDAGHATSSSLNGMELKEAFAMYFLEIKRNNLIENHIVSVEDARGMNASQLAVRDFQERNRQFILREHPSPESVAPEDYAKAAVELTGRLRLQKGGDDAAFTKPRKVVAVKEAEYRRIKFLEKAGVSVPEGGSLTTTFYKVSTRLPQVIKLVKLLDEDLYPAPPPIPQSVSANAGTSVKSYPSNVATAPLSSFVNETTANMYTQLVGRYASQMDLTKSFTPSTIFRIVQLSSLYNKAPNDKNFYGGIIQRAIIERMRGFEAQAGSIKTCHNTVPKLTGYAQVVINRYGGFAFALQKLKISFKLSPDDIPPSLADEVKTRFSSSAWLTGNMPCGVDTWKKSSEYDLAEIKWLALLFSSNYLRWSYYG